MMADAKLILLDEPGAGVNPRFDAKNWRYDNRA